MANLTSYRHRVTGLVGQYTADFAAVFPDILEEVAVDAKPLAYVPISVSAIAELDTSDTKATDL